jgi:hypothetical protein
MSGRKKPPRDITFEVYMFKPILRQPPNDEWYTYPSTVRLILPYVEKFRRIWTPFDTADSSFVKELRAAGHEVIHSHIADGQDFFTYTPPTEDYDAIISNPPFSLRERIYQRLFALQKPFAVLGSERGLFGSRTRFNLFKENRFEILIPQGRRQFFNGDKILIPPFQTWFICHDVLPKQIIFCDSEEKKERNES